MNPDQRRRLVTVAIRVLLGAVFVYAGATKLAHPEQFADSIASFRHLPDSLINPIALGLPPLEILAGLLMTTGWHSRPANLAIIILTGAFTIALAQALIRGLPIDCGCFGAGEPSVVNTWLDLARDLLLFVAALFIYSTQLMGVQCLPSSS